MILGLLAAALALVPGAALALNYDIALSLDPEARSLTAELRIAAETRERLTVPPGLEIVTARHAGRPVAPGDLAGPGEIVVIYRARFPGLAEGTRTGEAFVDSEATLLPPGAWYPAFGTRPFTYSVTVDVPESQRAIVPGDLVLERTDRGRTVSRFEFDAPADEITLFAGPYRVGERRAGDRLIRTYFLAGLDDLAPRYLDAVARDLDRYSAAIGPYPARMFAVVAGPLPVGFGFPTLTYLSRDILRLPFVLDRSLSHEVLHAWWGNGVRVNYAAGNWAEALTTFMADYAAAEAAGPDAARAMRRGWLDDLAVLPPERDIALAEFRSRRHSADQVVGYGKGAMLFQMIRDRIGEEVFAAGLRRFWRERRFSVASWTELERALSAEAGEDLRPFFEAWVGRRGLPPVRLQEASARGDGVSLTLVQDAKPFPLRLPVTVETDAGTETHWVALDQTATRAELRTAARPLRLRVDPDQRALRRIAAHEVTPTIRSLMVASDAVLTLPEADAGLAETAQVLVANLIDRGATTQAADAADNRSLLLVGRAAELAALAAKLSLPARPSALERAGSGKVWAGRRPNGAPFLAVEIADATALRQLAPVVRHYGGLSYLVFEGSRVVARGVDPPSERSLMAEFVR